MIHDSAEKEKIMNLKVFPINENHESLSYRKYNPFVKKRDQEIEKINNKSKNKAIAIVNKGIYTQVSNLLLPSIEKNKRLSESNSDKDVFQNNDKIVTQINQTFLLKLFNLRKENDKGGKKDLINNSAAAFKVNTPSTTIKKIKKIVIIKNNSPSLSISLPHSSLPTSLYTQLSSQLPSPSNHISLTKTLIPIDLKRQFKYTYYIYPGNNASLIDKCMKTRPQWEPISQNLSEFAYFIWSPLSKEIKYNRQQKTSQYVNHLEYHCELSNKMNLFANLMKECESHYIDLFSIFPFTISIQLNHHTMINQLNSFKQIYDNIQNYLMTNDFNQSKYIDMFNISLSKKLGTNQRINIPITHYDSRNFWLIKPVNMNRGRCIIIENSYEKIVNELNHIKEQNKLSNQSKLKISKVEYIIIQKYIEKPLLYQKRKFDIRIWVLFNDQCDVYVFTEGHLKATCDDFDLKSNNPFVHLTNFSVQKHHMNFSKKEIGNEISFADFQKELDTNNTGISFRKDIYPKICNIIKLSAMAVKNRINFMSRKTCFEIFGYDFLIDQEYNPFLIEINTNPGLEDSSPLIKMLTERMIDDALRLTIDNLTKNSSYNNDDGDGSENCLKNPSVFPVDSHSNNENLWQKLHIPKCI